MSEPEYAVVDRPADARFVLTRDGEELGFSAYTRGDGEIVFTHTEIDPEVQEHGLGSRLVAGALDQVRDGSADRVIAECPFVVEFISGHPEYEELLAR